MVKLLICLAVFCLILLFVLIKQDDKNTKLAAENGLMKGRIETLQEWAFQLEGFLPLHIMESKDSDLLKSRIVEYVNEVILPRLRNCAE